MKKYFIYLVVLLQVAVLAWLVFDRESTLLSGENVWLKTEPIDPLDPLRGQYVTLNYEISDPSPNLYSERLMEELKALGESEESRSHSRKYPSSIIPVFVSLSSDKRNVAHATKVDTEPPKNGLFLKGEINATRSWRRNTITYGIESYYVEQGKGPDIESRARDNPRSLEMNIRINKKGTAVIESFRWSGVEMLFTQDNQGNCFLTFENHDELPTAIIIPNDFSTIDFSYFVWDPTPRMKAAETTPVIGTPEESTQKKFFEKDIRIIPPNDEITVQVYPPFEHMSRRTMSGIIRYEIPDDAILPSLPMNISSWTNKLHTRAIIQTQNGPDHSVDLE